MIVTLTLPMPPSLNNLYRNVPGKGRVPAEKFRRWKHDAGWHLNCQHPQKIAGPVELEFWFAEPKTKRRIDLDGKLKAAIDLLVSHQIIAGDHSAIVRSIKLSWKSIEGCVVQVVSVAAAQEVAA